MYPQSSAGSTDNKEQNNMEKLCEMPLSSPPRDSFLGKEEKSRMGAHCLPDSSRERAATWDMPTTQCIVINSRAVIKTACPHDYPTMNLHLLEATTDVQVFWGLLEGLSYRGYCSCCVKVQHTLLLSERGDLTQPKVYVNPRTEMSCTAA